MNSMEKSRRNSLATLIYDCAREVHEHTGPGILPGIFRSCLAHEMRLRGLRFRMNAAITVVYKGIRIEEKLFADFIVEEEIAVNIFDNPLDKDFQLKRMQSILAFSGCGGGVWLDTSNQRLVDGFKKIINLKKTVI